MPIDADSAYRALTARDARFDGHWFVGVTSTRVYCRPICRVRTPKRENCRFFETPAQAEAAAFRPCMKCRPEIAPGATLPWSVMDASRTLARQAAQCLDLRHSACDGLAVGEAPNIGDLAVTLGVSERHLRRIFHAEHGVTPLQYLQTRRLLLAKQLLTDTQLPVTQVALASGFKSLRRFNAAFADSYRMSPGRLRRNAAPDAAADDPCVSLSLGWREPYDVQALLRFFAQRAIPGIEHVEAMTLRRSVRAGVMTTEAGWIEARFEPNASKVRLLFSPQWAMASARIASAARRWLDLDATPQIVDAALADLPGAPGLRLPGSLDAFELAVRAVLGQQVTVAAARTLAIRLVARYGQRQATPWTVIDRVFAAPETLAATSIDEIAQLGIVRSRAGAIVALAQAWPRIDAHIGSSASPEAMVQALIETLCALPGIGPWTAHYIAMRALSWPDAFPPRDVATIKAMQQLFSVATPAAAESHAQAWRPWRSYAVLRLWNSLETPS
ncbi:MAG: Ada metal-binding domain-containing protein [Burkholderiaceae bacterium]